MSSSSAQIYPAPANDSVAAAEAMVESKTLTRTLLGATTEPNEPEPERPSVWFSWTAPESGIARLRLGGTQVPGWRVHVFAGETWQEEIARATGETGSVLQVEFNTKVGTKYLFAVKSEASVVKSFSLLLTAGVTVPNDNFADRIVLSGTNLTVEVALEMATKELGEWGVWDGIAFRSAWYEWTPPGRGELTIQVESIGKQTNHWGDAGLYAGWTTPFEWQSLRQLRPAFDNWIYEQTWWVEPSTNYAIALDADFLGTIPNVPGSMEVRMKLKFTAPPENDAFDNRITAAGERVTFSGTLEAATADLISTRRTVWYEWTAPGNGLASLAVIEPQGVSSAIFYSSNGILTAIGNIPGSMRATNFFEAQAGTNYFIAVHSLWGWPGYDFEARIDLNGPENDDFADRVHLSGTHAIFPIRSFRASVETNEPAGLPNSTWWSWTAPYSGWATLRSQGDSFSVFTGATLETLQELPVERLAKSEWRLPTTVTGFECAAGGTYQIAVHRVTESLRNTEGELDLTSLRFAHPVDGTRVRARERVQIQMAPIDKVIDGELSEPVVFVRADSIYNGSVVEGAGDPTRFLTSFVDTGYDDNYGPRKYYAFTTNAAGVLKVSRPLQIELVLENDHFAEATPIILGPWWPRTTFGKATLEAGEAELLEINSLPLVSRWWRWDPARDCEMEFSVSANTGMLQMGVYRGTTFESLEKVTNKLSSDWLVSVRFRALAGSRYYIALATEKDRGFTPQVRTSEKLFHIEPNTGRVHVWYADGFGNGYAVVEKSTDLRNWEPLYGAFAGAAFEYYLTNGPAYFFRARSE